MAVIRVDNPDIGNLLAKIGLIGGSDDAKEENVNLNFMIPSEDIFINDHISTSLNSNNSKSYLLNISFEVIK